MSVPTVAWVLPRPSKSKYPGSVPLHFEKKLVRHLGIDPTTAAILQPFGGMGELGIRCDLRDTHPLAAQHGDAVIWRKPDYVCDAHDLPFEDDTFDLVFLDPPYSAQEATDLYGTHPPIYKKYIVEAVRVAKPGGFIASYNVVMTPRPDGTVYHSRILLGTRVWHRLRACCIFQKGLLEIEERLRKGVVK